MVEKEFKMKAERLAKFSKEDLIKFHLRQTDDLEFYKEKFAKQEKVGQAYFEHKKYNIIFEREE